MDLSRFQQQLKGAATDSRPIPPVEQWNPPFCGDINLEIHLDGRWFYENSPIGRASLVRLFASVLKKEGGDYFLVTPVEKVGIQVQDVPFLITDWQCTNDTIEFITQTGDKIALTTLAQLELRSPPIALQDTEATPIPYINVRRNLWARLHQNVYYQLIEHAQQVESPSHTEFQLASAGLHFVIGKL